MNFQFYSNISTYKNQTNVWITKKLNPKPCLTQNRYKKGRRDSRNGLDLVSYYTFSPLDFFLSSFSFFETLTRKKTKGTKKIVKTKYLIISQFLGASIILSLTSQPKNKTQSNKTVQKLNFFSIAKDINSTKKYYSIEIFYIISRFFHYAKD